MIFNSKLIKGALIAFVSLLATSQSAFAQSVVQMGTTELKTEAKALVDENKYLEARPFIVELIKRINDSQDEALKKELEQLNYFLAFSYLQEYNNTPEKKHINRAISGFDRVINEFPNGSYAESAIKTKASCYDLIARCEQCEVQCNITASRCIVNHIWKILFNCVVLFLSNLTLDKT